jgi:hypothetical protein
MLDPCCLHGIQHAFGLLGGACQGFLADDVLAGLCGGDAGLGMEVVGAAIVEDLNIGVVDQVVPVGGVRLVAVATGGLGYLLLGAAGDGYQARNGIGRPVDVGDLAEGVAMRFAHEGVAEHADTDDRDLAGGFRVTLGNKPNLLRHMRHLL